MGRARLIRSGLVGAALLVGLAGAAVAQSPAPSGGAAAAGLDGTNWLLGSVTTDGATTAVASGIGASLDFLGTEAGGSGGCNHFFAPYESSMGSLTFGPIGATRMACDEATMALEDSYLGALATVATYTEADGSLTLMDGTGTSVLTFGAAPVATVEGPWIVTGYDDGSAIATPAADSAPSVAFSPDGHVEGFGGCNDFSGGYSLDGTTIAIGPLMSTMKSCGEALDTQEQQFLAALDAATSWTNDSGTLVLKDFADEVQVTAVSAVGH